MPTFYNYTENGVVYSFDDVFVPANAFRQGNLWSWGFNLQGQLGINDTTSRGTPVTTFAGGNNWKSVDGGYKHTAAIKTDGTLWTWGINAKGQLGINDTTDRNTPVQTFVGGTNWKFIACGYDHTVALKTDGTLWVWGDNNIGPLGVNDQNRRTTPVTTFAGGNNWKSIAGGRNHTAAIKTDGTLWTWGGNAYGQIGQNNFSNTLTPVTTFAGGNNWKQVSCGRDNTAAITTYGCLGHWGRGWFGGNGNNNNTTNINTPVTTFVGGNNWKQVSCGALHTAAIKTDGTLWTWGFNLQGQLGINDTTTRCTPVTTFSGGTNWKSVDGGYRHMLAIKTDGTLWTWGLNSSGQLGINDTTSRGTPVTTSLGGTNWKTVATAGYHTLALTFMDDII